MIWGLNCFFMFGWWWANINEWPIRLHTLWGFSFFAVERRYRRFIQLPYMDISNDRDIKDRLRLYRKIWQDGAVELDWVSTRTEHDGWCRGVWPTLVDRRSGRRTVPQGAVDASRLKMRWIHIFILCAYHPLVLSYERRKFVSGKHL